MQFSRVTKTVLGLGEEQEFFLSSSPFHQKDSHLRNYDYVSGRFIFLRCKCYSVEFLLLAFQGSSDSTEMFRYYREIATGK